MLWDYHKVLAIMCNDYFFKTHFPLLITHSEILIDSKNLRLTFSKILYFKQMSGCRSFCFGFSGPSDRVSIYARTPYAMCLNFQQVLTSTNQMISATSHLCYVQDNSDEEPRPQSLYILTVCNYKHYKWYHSTKKQSCSAVSSFVLNQTEIAGFICINGTCSPKIVLITESQPGHSYHKSLLPRTTENKKQIQLKAERDECELCRYIILL